MSQQDETVTAADGTAFVITSAVVRVPERRTGASTTGTIDLGVVRARRASAAARTGSAHVILAGGPGDSGVNLVLGLVRQGGGAIADLIDGEIIGIDQRGTGRSSPGLASAVRYGLPQDRPGSPEVWRPFIERAIQAVRADLVARGIHLEAYNTRESADDVDAVRQALGYERVTLWGRSYGSHLALATLRRHPQAVQRLVLIGPEGPDHTWKLPGVTDAVITRIAERAGQPGLTELMRSVITRLTAAPASVSIAHPVTHQPITVVVGGFDLQWVTAQALGDPRMLRTLPAAYRRMASGDFAGIAPIVFAMRERLGVETAMKHAMDLGSGASLGRRARIELEARTAVLGNAFNLPGMSLAEAWRVTPLDDGFREPVHSAVPVLILAGDLDPRTPIENGREIVSTLPNGQLVIVENATHQFDVFGSSPIRTLLRRFLAGERVDNERVVLPPLGFQ
ncbi:MAG: alpha/beta fold hydrolase [Vicinamibacterales bacterium]